ncbi:MAG: DinB family protein [Planctomycetota bacterium]
MMKSEWQTMTGLFDLMRTMAASMAEEIPDEHFNVARGGSNSPKWITGHLALAMNFGLNILGEPTEAIAEMMPSYGPGSPGGAVEDDKTKEMLVQHMRTVGDQLKEKVAVAEPSQFDAPNETPFLADALPTAGDLLAHVYTTHIALHTGQLSQIRREIGLPSLYQF